MKILILDTEAPYYASELAQAVPGPEYLTATTPEAALALARGPQGASIEVLVALAPKITPELTQALPGLKWVQALTTGVDNLAGLNTSVALTNCHGIHGPQMSELAVLLMMASARGFARMHDNQRSTTWERWPQPLLEGKTACLIGVGAIAQHLAGVLNALGMRVTGITGREDVPGFAKLYDKSQMATALSETDFVIVLTPYTPGAPPVIDAAALAAMPPRAHLVNLSRGGCVDEDAVVAALRAGRLAGAALDVFACEPLPADSPLWSEPGIIITPHVGGFADVYHTQALPIVAANLTAYIASGVDGLERIIP